MKFDNLEHWLGFDYSFLPYVRDTIRRGTQCTSGDIDRMRIWHCLWHCLECLCVRLFCTLRFFCTLPDAPMSEHALIVSWWNSQEMNCQDCLGLHSRYSPKLMFPCRMSMKSTKLRQSFLHGSTQNVMGSTQTLIHKGPTLEVESHGSTQTLMHTSPTVVFQHFFAPLNFLGSSKNSGFASGGNYNNFETITWRNW